MGLIRVGSRSHKMTSRQFVRSWLSIWYFPSCDKDGNRNAWPLSYPSGNLTREEPRKRPNTCTASAVDWGNLGTPSSVPTPQLPDSPASRGAGRRGLEAKPGDTGRRAWGYAARGEAERRTWGQPGMKMWGEDRAAREAGPGWRATGEARPGVRSDAGAGWGLTRVLQRLDVLGSGRQFRHHLDELGPGFLVLLEHCGERHKLESASRGPRAPPSSLPRRGDRAYLAAPASDSWRPRLCARHRLLCLTRQSWACESMERATAATARPPTAEALSVYPRLPGNRPEPERGRLAATAVPSVTSRRGAWAPVAVGGLRWGTPPARLPGLAEFWGPPREPCAVEGHTFWAQASARRSKNFTNRTQTWLQRGGREPRAPRKLDPSAARQANCRDGVSWDSTVERNLTYNTVLSDKYITVSAVFKSNIFPFSPAFIYWAFQVWGFLEGQDTSVHTPNYNVLKAFN